LKPFKTPRRHEIIQNFWGRKAKRVPTVLAFNVHLQKLLIINNYSTTSPNFSITIRFAKSSLKLQVLESPFKFKIQWVKQGINYVLIQHHREQVIIIFISISECSCHRETHH